MNEADRWHSDPTYHAPMIVTNSGEHVYVGDIVEFMVEHDGDRCISAGKIKMFLIEVLGTSEEIKHVHALM